MDHFSYIKEQVRQKLLRATVCSKHVKDASSFILTLSEHAEGIATLWLELFQFADSPSFQLTLLYVANEVLIKCTKYGVPEFKDIFRPFVVEAVKYLRPGNLVPKLTKLFNYWSHYKLFDVKFVQQLLNTLGQSDQSVLKYNGTTSLENEQQNFQPEKLISSLRVLKDLDDELAKLPKLDCSGLYLGVPTETIVSSLKSKNESRTLSHQVDTCCKKLESSIKKQNERLAHLTSLNELLNASEMYYETQHKEVAVVVNAYLAYEKRVSETLSMAQSLINPDSNPGPTFNSSPFDRSSPPRASLSEGEVADLTDDFGADNDDDDDSDIDNSTAYRAGPHLSQVTYQPSPILKDSNTIKVDSKSPLTTVQPSPLPGTLIDSNPIKPSGMTDFPLDAIRDASGDVDYRILLDPSRRLAQAPLNSWPVGDAPVSSVRVQSTEGCQDDDGDNMEMSDGDEPEDSNHVLEPAASENGDKDWRIFTMVSSVDQVPSAVPPRSSVPPHCSFPPHGTESPQPSNPFGLPPSKLIPSPPPPDIVGLPSEPAEADRPSIHMAPHSRLIFPDLPPGPRIPAGMLSRFPPLTDGKSMCFPRPAHDVAVVPAPTSSNTTPSLEQSESIPTEQKLTTTVDVQEMTSSSSSSSPLPSATQETPAVANLSLLLTSTTQVTSNRTQQTVSEDPFAIISRLTGLSNLMKSLEAKSTSSSNPDLPVSTGSGNNTVVVSSVLQTSTISVLEACGSKAQSVSVPPVDAPDKTDATLEVAEPPRKQTKLSDPVNPPISESVEVLDSLNQQIDESSPTGGETPTQDEHEGDQSESVFPISGNFPSFLMQNDSSLPSNTTPSMPPWSALPITGTQSIPSITGSASATSNWPYNQPFPGLANPPSFVVPASSSIPTYPGPVGSIRMSIPSIPPPPLPNLMSNTANLLRPPTSLCFPPSSASICWPGASNSSTSNLLLHLSNYISPPGSVRPATHNPYS